MTDCVRSTLRANAFKGPFQGLGATLVRNVPANSIYLGSFEVLKDHIARWQGIKKTELGGRESRFSPYFRKVNISRFLQNLIFYLAFSAA